MRCPMGKDDKRIRGDSEFDAVMLGRECGFEPRIFHHLDHLKRVFSHSQHGFVRMEALHVERQRKSHFRSSALWRERVRVEQRRRHLDAAARFAKIVDC